MAGTCWNAVIRAERPGPKKIWDLPECGNSAKQLYTDFFGNFLFFAFFAKYYFCIFYKMLLCKISKIYPTIFDLKCYFAFSAKSYFAKSAKSPLLLAAQNVTLHFLQNVTLHFLQNVTLQALQNLIL